MPDDDGSAALDDNLDYQDVKLKIVQQEGYDAHDFNLFDDRASQLWRKPYVEGAVQELTSNDNRSSEQLRTAVEQMMLAARQPEPGCPSDRIRRTQVGRHGEGRCRDRERRRCAVARGESYQTKDPDRPLRNKNIPRTRQAQPRSLRPAHTKTYPRAPAYPRPRPQHAIPGSPP